MLRSFVIFSAAIDVRRRVLALVGQSRGAREPGLGCRRFGAAAMSIEVLLRF